MTASPRSWNWWRVVTVTALAGLAAAGLVYWGVVDPEHALAAVAVASALSVVWVATARTTADPEWPHLDVEARAGGRHDVSDLGWSVFGRDGLVTDRVVRRIRVLAATRLRALGVDPADPAARADVERLLGARVVRQLASPLPPSARTVQLWLDAIERLPATAPADVPTSVPTTKENRA